jgi:tetratricopeptide (TPR) repeat protein
MRRACALAALLLLAQPAAAQAPLGPYEEAVAARQAGDPALAATLLRRVIEGEPGNADAQLQLGLSLLALGQLDEAEAAFGRTLAIAPAYADAQIGLARIAQRRGDRRRALALLEQIDPANREAAELRAALGTSGIGAHPVQLDLDLSYSELDGPAPTGARQACASGFRPQNEPLSPRPPSFPGASAVPTFMANSGSTSASAGMMGFTSSPAPRRTRISARNGRSAQAASFACAMAAARPS